MEQWNRELEQLFGQYRSAVPDREASANFMPELWRKIESRQRLVVRFKRLTQMFLAGAAAICLLFGILLQVPVKSVPAQGGNFVDELAEANPAENLSALGIRIDYPEPDSK